MITAYLLGVATLPTLAVLWVFWDGFYHRKCGIVGGRYFCEENHLRSVRRNAK